MSDACVCPMVTPLGKGTIVIHTTVLILFYTEHTQDLFFCLSALHLLYFIHVAIFYIAIKW